MKAVKHPCVIDLKDVLATRDKIYIVMELVTGGELFEIVAARGRLPENEARAHFQRLIDGVDFCHTRGVFHRDLKPENLLLDQSGKLKISDFGLSALIAPSDSPTLAPRSGSLLTTTCGALSLMH
jgi:serine/threonine protein kinase